MQPPQLPCNCLARTTETLGCFPDLSTRSPTETYRIPLDEVLSLGTALVEHWELLHGCTVTDTHLDTSMLRAMMEAAVKTLTLYEAAVESILGGWGKESDGGGIDHSPPSNGDTVETKPTVVVTEVPVYFGAMELDRQEKTIAARETLRHAAMRLGKMLQDIEDMGANPGNEQARQLKSRLFRILGRLNS
ncbi:Transcription factor [Penicillium robsamsonii]|uniref:Transcription factor n=1 Tax=Penicillium robsamsonii TaxID=1792511 RepID=UPI0025474C82|nr:Transcription factor [Penicillium robsamsonii]KAJ5824537.1 Transcription factor [Penicillium robsamsonii]